MSEFDKGEPLRVQPFDREDIKELAKEVVPQGGDTPSPKFVKYLEQSFELEGEVGALILSKSLPKGVLIHLSIYNDSADETYFEGLAYLDTYGKGYGFGYNEPEDGIIMTYLEETQIFNLTSGAFAGNYSVIIDIFQ